MVRYDPYTDSFIDDLIKETTATSSLDAFPKDAVLVQMVEVSDESIEKIADAVVRKLADCKTEPQYDFSEYADRLWKIAYERGKREALEQTEPQTEMPRCSVNGTPFDECGFCEYFNCDTCRCEADVPQTERSSE